MKKVKIGDIVEIPLPGGEFAYAQFTHYHQAPPRYGALLRVFTGAHESHREKFEDLPGSEVQFVTFFPLQAAVNKGLVRIVFNLPVPPEAQKFPTFRVSGLIDPTTRRALSWGIWDGEKEWKVKGELTDEQRKLPILEGINDTLLVERIISRWTPEMDRA